MTWVKLRYKLINVKSLKSNAKNVLVENVIAFEFVSDLSSTRHD